MQAVLAVLPTVQDALRALPAGHHARQELLALQATLLAARAALGSGTEEVSAALYVAVGAAEVAALLGRDQSRMVCDAVVVGLIGALARNVAAGPFARGQAALESALAARAARVRRDPSVSSH